MAWSRESDVFMFQSLMSWWFPWVIEHKDEVSWLDNSSSWSVLGAIFDIPETMEACLGCERESLSGSLLVLGDIVKCVLCKAL
jgi:hypothetical protein